jgi:tRNA dimethylallyltransferase
MSDSTTKPILVSVIGPTAVGKTGLSIEMAKEFNTEIISADSRQFYKELEIGTAKPTLQELTAIKHHFIDSHTIEQHYSAGEYGREAKELLQNLFSKKKILIAVGGSSLYLKALWEGFDVIPQVNPEIRSELNEKLEREGLEPLLNELKEKDNAYYHQVDQKNGQRIIRALEVIRGTGKKFSHFRQNSKKKSFYSNIKIGLNLDRDLLFDRINSRMDAMIEQGLFEEAKGVYAYRSHNALQTVGYSEIFGFLDHEYDKEEAIRLLKRNSRRYAKRQLTWFNRYDDINWFEPSQKEEIIQMIKSSLS